MNETLRNLGRSGVLALAIWGGVFSTALAAEGEEETVFERIQTAENKSLYDVNIAVPTVTALSILGKADPDGIGADIAPDLYFQFTPSENGVPEIAVSIRPYWVVGNPNKTVSDYQDDAITSGPERIFARTRLSLAVANNAEGEGFGVGFGLNTVLTGKSDPRSDRLFLTCVQDAGQTFTDRVAFGHPTRPGDLEVARSAFTKAHPRDAGNAASYDAAIAIINGATNLGQLQVAFDLALRRMGLQPDAANAEADRLFDEVDAAISQDEMSVDVEAYGDCVKKATTRYQARPAWAVGIGGTYRAVDREFDSLEYAGTSVWTTYRIPLFGASDREVSRIKQAEADLKAGSPVPDSIQNPEEGDAWKGGLVLSARYVSNDKIDVAGTLQAAATTIAAAQFRVARGPMEFSTTVAYYNREFTAAGPADDQFTRYSGTAKFPVGRGVALDFSGGKSSGSVHGDEDFFILRITATGDALERIVKLRGFLEMF